MKTVMNDLIFEVTQEADGGFVAECLTEPIVTQGDSWDELRAAANEAVRGYFFDPPEKLPARIRLHLVRDESFALA
jgi:predicted RNase H-like HicB family nuclease